MSQKVLIMETPEESLRVSVDGWGYEDASLVVWSKPIGLTPSWAPHAPRPNYPTVLHALSDGWKLLAPPRKLAEKRFEWWFTKD